MNIPRAPPNASPAHVPPPPTPPAPEPTAVPAPPLAEPVPRHPVGLILKTNASVTSTASENSSDQDSAETHTSPQGRNPPPCLALVPPTPTPATPVTTPPAGSSGLVMASNPAHSERSGRPIQFEPADVPLQSITRPSSPMGPAQQLLNTEAVATQPLIQTSPPDLCPPTSRDASQSPASQSAPPAAQSQASHPQAQGQSHGRTHGSFQGQSQGQGQSQPPKRRPVLQRFYSMPHTPSMSPARQHIRLQNTRPHYIKETPSVSYSQDARGQFINQYLIQREVGRGSYGMVYLATDPTTNTSYAIKEYSKARLLKLNRRAVMQMRRQGGRTTVGVGASGASGGTTGGVVPGWTPATAGWLIRGEVAIMKRIDHPNLASLHEVIDDQRSDLLYMVLEWCENGTIMPPECDYDGNAEPLDEEQCRLYFRDMILGVEYLHAHGIAHRDIKADNVLLGEDDVLKLADFGVSEMFENPDDDSVKKCVGSPAYMAPELARLAGGGNDSIPTSSLNKLSGRKTDIWAMGATLYYMFHGHLPFEAQSLGELYDKIINDEPVVRGCSPDMQALFARLLSKQTDTRITMAELRVHPWVTRGGSDHLLSYESNTGVVVGDSVSDDSVSEADINSALESLQQRGAVIDWRALARSLRTDYGYRGSDSNPGSAASTPPASSGAAGSTGSADSDYVTGAAASASGAIGTSALPSDLVSALASAVTSNAPSAVPSAVPSAAASAAPSASTSPVHENPPRPPLQRQQSVDGMGKLEKLCLALDEILRRDKWGQAKSAPELDPEQQ